MSAKLKVDQLETVDGTGNITVNNQLTGLTSASIPTLSSSHMPTGSVIQCASYRPTVQAWNSTSTSYISTDLTLDFTPLFADSTLIVHIHATFYRTGSGATYGQIRKDGSTLTGYTHEDLPSYNSTTTASGELGSAFWTGPAGSTATATYAYYYKASDGALGYIYRNRGIYIMEIAG